MHLPAESYHVRLEPMKLVVATRGMLHGIIALLKCDTRTRRKNRSNE
jgi:hypothetical protein